ncbi:hypothetical protein [uncultured Pelagimonas sp.]|uniref:hypothetical protein n=1 Tax=uncultured Pelagimonas sp. TaxID=1618102 RepID=UPI0026371ECF|nr:hypothetical protein [uncultured Pelagimonas sp.]
MPDYEFGRAFVEHNRSEVHIVIPARRKIFTTGFLAIWLCGWLIGEISALAGLIIGVTEPTSVFWLIGWTIGGFCVGVTLLWLLVGKEEIHLTADKVSLTRSIRLWTRTTICKSSNISKMRCEEPLVADTLNAGFFSLRSTGQIKFSYESKTFGFGLDLNEVEARRLLALILERYPQFFNGT